MATGPKPADLVLPGCVGLAVLALGMLGWQAIQSLDATRTIDASMRNAGTSPGTAVIIALAVSAIIAMLLWALFHYKRTSRRAETRLERMADRLPGGFYVLSLDDRGVSSYEFLTVNAANLLGVSRDQVLQDPELARRLVIMEDRERVDAALVQSRQTMTPFEIDFRIQKPDGEIRWVRTLAVPARTSSHIVWNGHLFDITDIRQTEHALRLATERLEEAQSVASFGDWTCEFATGQVTWSPQVFKLLGREPSLGPPSLAEVIDMPLEGPEPMAMAFEMAQETGEPQYFEASARLSSDKVVTLDVIVLPVADAAGHVIGMRGTMQDITARKALERRLSLAKDAADSANQAKSEFLATMSHEIRTPLNGMLGILELISLNPLNPEIRTALQDVRESGESLQRIIDDILDFSKVEAGKLEIRPEPSRLTDVMDSLRRIYASGASSVGLDFNLHVDAGISPVLLMDALRVRQILSNFVSNAIKFTPAGRIDLRVLLAGREAGVEHLRFEVQDTGIGISPNDQQALFKPFEQARSNARRSGGTGLGLSITRRLAELMGGRVSLASELGAGTTMTLEIEAPVVEAALPASPAIAPSTPSVDPTLHDANPMRDRPSMSPQAGTVEARILVVDDHPTNRMVMRNQILALGYAAEDVGNAAEAVARWRAGNFALVLTDLNMPIASGYDLARQIRQAEADAGGPRTPIIACSANVIAGVVQECLAAGMDDYIAKPMKLADLSEKLTRWLPLPLQRHHANLHGQPSSPGPAADASGPARKTDHPPGRIKPGVSRRVLAQFKEVNDVDVEQLIAAVEGGDMDAITHNAHRIKGACGFIGATGLAAVCGMIEQASRQQDAPGVAWLMETFHMELEQLNATIES